MTALERLKAWLATFPRFDILSAFQVDYTDRIPANGGIFPSGMVEVERMEDILGNVEVTNQYNFGIYYVFAKAAGDDAGALVNADWLMEFQEWVQEQSIRRLAPTFGDEPNAERLMAQNGVLYEAEGDGTATYVVQLSIQYKKRFEV